MEFQKFIIDDGDVICLRHNNKTVHWKIGEISKIYLKDPGNINIDDLFEDIDFLNEINVTNEITEQLIEDAKIWLSYYLGKDKMIKDKKDVMEVCRKICDDEKSLYTFVFNVSPNPSTYKGTDHITVEVKNGFSVKTTVSGGSFNEILDKLQNAFLKTNQQIIQKDGKKYLLIEVDDDTVSRYNLK